MDREGGIVRSEVLARDCGIPVRIAREIVMEQTRLQLRRSGWAWAVVVLALVCSGWLWLSASDHTSAVYVLLGAGCLWMLVGRWQATPAIRCAAARRAARMHGGNTAAARR